MKAGMRAAQRVSWEQPSETARADCHSRLAAKVALRLVPWALSGMVLLGGVRARSQQVTQLPDDPSAGWAQSQPIASQKNEPTPSVETSFETEPTSLVSAELARVDAFRERTSMTTNVASLEAMSTEAPWPALARSAVTAESSSSQQSGSESPRIGQQEPSAAGQAKSSQMPQCPTGLMADFVVLRRKDRYACERQDPLQFIVEPGPVAPLTPTQKAVLAGRGVINPFNLLTIAAFSGISVAANAHSAYGPGFHGWGLLMGYSLVEDIQGETTGTFLLPVAFHEDPRYHRLPGQPFTHRLLHALGHTVLSQGDDGHIMPNYATLINYPLSAEISNLYVPGIATNGPSTVKRIALGYATDPVGAIVAEFLPDVARRVHIHIIFAQQILNQIATGQLIGQQ